MVLKEFLTWKWKTIGLSRYYRPTKLVFLACILSWIVGLWFWIGYAAWQATRRQKLEGKRYRADAWPEAPNIRGHQLNRD